MSKEPIEFLRHIFDECSFLMSVNKNITNDNFLADETMGVNYLIVWDVFINKIPELYLQIQDVLDKE